MNSSLDLNLLLIARQGDGEPSELPDLYAVTPPRRAARGRETDSLIIYLSMVGNSPLTPQAHKQLLEEMAQKFYKTTGSLTAALRTVAEALNLHLLDRNLRSTSAGRQGIGQLLLVALRADMLYIAESGAVRAFQVTPQETQPLYDLQTSGRGLGLSRSLPVRFLQIKMAADDYLLLSTIAAPGWSDASIKHPAQQGMEALRRQLMESAGQEFNAVIIQAQAGTGKLKLLKRKAEAGGLSYPAAGRSANRRCEPLTSAAAAQAVDAPSEDHGLGRSLGLSACNQVRLTSPRRIKALVSHQLLPQLLHPSHRLPSNLQSHAGSTISRSPASIPGYQPELTLPWEQRSPRLPYLRAESVPPVVPTSKPASPPAQASKKSNPPQHLARGRNTSLLLRATLVSIIGSHWACPGQCTFHYRRCSPAFTQKPSTRCRCPPASSLDDGFYCHCHPPGPGRDWRHRFPSARSSPATANLLPAGGGESSLCRHPHQPPGAAHGLANCPGRAG